MHLRCCAGCWTEAGSSDCGKVVRAENPMRKWKHEHQFLVCIFRRISSTFQTHVILTCLSSTWGQTPSNQDQQQHVVCSKHNLNLKWERIPSATTELIVVYQETIGYTFFQRVWQQIIPLVPWTIVRADSSFKRWIPAGNSDVHKLLYGFFLLEMSCRQQQQQNTKETRPEACATRLDFSYRGNFYDAGSLLTGVNHHSNLSWTTNLLRSKSLFWVRDQWI